MMNPAYEILNVRGRLIALCVDGSIWAFDVPKVEEGKDALLKREWIRLPDIPKGR
jgi:hypothetical protein